MQCLGMKANVCHLCTTRYSEFGTPIKTQYPEIMYIHNLQMCIQSISMFLKKQQIYDTEFYFGTLHIK